MATFVNHVAIAAPRNATNTHTVSPSSGTATAGTLFTPTAGNFLVCLVEGAVTSSTPTGWTLPTNGSAVNNTGLYLWYRTAAGGDSLTTTHNGSNYPVIFHFIEFAAGTTFDRAASSVSISSGAAGAAMTGLTGTNWTAGVVASSWVTTTGTSSVSWNAGTELVDVGTPNVTTDGYAYGLTYIEDDVATSRTFTATYTAPGGSASERLAFSLKVATGATPVTGTLSASVPKVTATISGASIPPITGGIAASVPKLTASLPGTVDDTVGGVMAATLPRATAAISGSSLTVGTLAATAPKVTANLPGTVTVTGSITAAVPKVTSSIADVALLTIAQENALTSGVLDRSNWFDYGNDVIPGFARSSYYTPGQTAQFSVDYNSSYTCEIYRLGWYGGAGNARRVATFAGTTASQPAATTIPGSNGAVTCAAWSQNVSWAIPTGATPGWYWLFMKNAGNTQFGGVLFCVSDANNKQPILVVASEATWGAAYNGYGGNNVYGATTSVGSINQRALCSSYDKPVLSRDNVTQTHFFNGELAQLRFLERFGFNVGYATIEQINNDPTVMDGRSLIVFSGHNEYIPQRVYDKTEAVIASGVNVANFAANDFFWRTAYSGNTFPTGNTSTSTGRVMWCRKDSMGGPEAIRFEGAGTPFSTQADWTGTWQDTRYTNRKPPANMLGDIFTANGIRGDEVKVPFAMKSLPLWRNAAGVQALTTGQTYSFGGGTAGMEWDIPTPPLPSVSLSASTVDLTNNTADVNGAIYDLDSTSTHAIQMVRNGSAHVLNFNTTQWGWAVDDLHMRGSSISTATARQATLNGLYDLGAVGVSSLITAASLTVPTPVSDIDVAYGLPASVTGSVAGATPKVTSSISGTVVTVGTMSATTPKVTGALTGSSLTIGSINGTTPKLTASVPGVIHDPITGLLNGTVPKVTAAIPGVSYAPVTGTIAGTVPLLTGALVGENLLPTTGSINAALPKVTANLVGAVTITGLLNGTLPRVRANLTGGGAHRDITFTGRIRTRTITGHVRG